MIFQVSDGEFSDPIATSLKMWKKSIVLSLFAFSVTLEKLNRNPQACPPPRLPPKKSFTHSSLVPPTRKLAARSLKLVKWAKLWRMAFNPSMCYLLLVFRTKCPFIHPYTMLGHTLQAVGHTLQAVDHYPYLGVSLSENLNWKLHIVNITNKANSTLGFVKRNLRHCPQKVKDQAYKSLVRPRLENGCIV